MAAQREQFAQKLSEILMSQQVISAQEATDLQKAFAESSHDAFVEFLLDEDLVEREYLLRALSQYYQVPFFDVNGYFFDHQLVKDFPKDLLLRHGAIPLEIDQNMLIVVTCEPDNQQLVPELNKYAPYDIQLMVGIRRDIEDAIKEFYDKSIQEYTDVDDEVELEEEEEDDLNRIEHEEDLEG